MEIVKIKIIKETSQVYFEEQLNKYSSELKAFATQTHITTIQDCIIYIGILFYHPNE